jgi:DNA-binding NtrC family response regulator
VARILLVEDDPDVRPLLEHILMGAGHRVVSATGVQESLGLIAADGYELVVTDLRLPDGDGRAIADVAVEGGAKVIILTGYGLSLPQGDHRSHTYLLKPIRPAEFLLAVGNVLGEVGRGIPRESDRF